MDRNKNVGFFLVHSCKSRRLALVGKVKLGTFILKKRRQERERKEKKKHPNNYRNKKETAFWCLVLNVFSWR